MVVIRHLIYRAIRLSDQSLSRCRVVPCLTANHTWLRGRNGSVLVWLERHPGHVPTRYVVPGRQLAWLVLLPGLRWLSPPTDS